MNILCITLVSILAAGPQLNLFNRADSLYREGRYADAMEMARKSASLSKEASDTTCLVKALCIQADIASDMGNDELALESYSQCLSLIPFTDQMFQLSSSLYNIASLYYQGGEYDKALEYVDKSISIDTKRGYDSIHALRYILAANICLDKGDYDKALELLDRSADYPHARNNNVRSRMVLLRARCLEAKSMPNPDWKQITGEYMRALEIAEDRVGSMYYGKVNPNSIELNYMVGYAMEKQGLDGSPWFLEAVRLSRVPHKMLGLNPKFERLSCLELARIFKEKGDDVQASKYGERAESLSYVPYLVEMGSKLSLSQLEFIRKDREREIERQKERSIYLMSFLAVFILAFAGLLVMYRRLLLHKRQIEEKNGQLVKLVLQKDQLISMLQEKKNHDTTIVDAIAKDTVPLPDIKLSKREIEIITLCCKGMISKEIASALNLSARTVESHKANIFRKVGVNTTNELIAFAYKYGLIK